MNMKAQLLTATLFTSFSGVLFAADPILLNLVMPDAKVVAGVNVQQAKGTPFGQFILNQMQTSDAQVQALIALTGFDPRRDVNELLVASDGAPQSHSGLALARGTFDVAMITAAATQHGAVTEVYGTTTIIEDPKQEGGIAFLNSTTVAAGDITSVKGAIDRQTMAQPLPAAILVKINQWSTSQDAWGITTVPPSSLAPPNAIKNGGQNVPFAGAAQNVQQAAGGVKFGGIVVFSGEATTDTAQNAQTLGDLVKLMINLAQMQAGTDPNAAALIKSVTVNNSGNVVKVSASLPEDTFIQMLQSGHKSASPATRSPRGPRQGK
ncbi:MAG TPA: hypothetical protein VMJ75_26100 [Candidatus Acidoferrales bacterium]|nr:hypothetical protein [Candidatus Acidoferrales bacterium]